jgi:hypothetical protein
VPQPKPFSSVNPTLPGFQRSLRRLSPEARALADRAILDLMSPEIPGKYGFKKLGGYRNPNVFTIMLGGNHAYKMSMEIDKDVAILRRVGTHRELDVNP